MFPVCTPVNGFLRWSCSFLIFSNPPTPLPTTHTHTPPSRLHWRCCLSPSRTHILLVKSHPRCTSVLSFLLWAILIYAALSAETNPVSVSTNGRVGSQRTPLTKVFCIKDLRFGCSSRPHGLLRLFKIHIGYLNPGIITHSLKIRLSRNDTCVSCMSSASSDLKGSYDDLICPKQLNVLTGLVFEEGGKFSQELPFVCRNKYNRPNGCGDSWLNTQSLFHGSWLILVSLSALCAIQRPEFSLVYARVGATQI